MTFDDIGYGILAQPHLAPDQAIAASDCDEGHQLRRETVGFRPLPGLAAEALASCLCRSDAGADALLDQLPFEVRNVGNDGRDHASGRRGEVEGQAGHRDDRYALRFQLLQRMQQVERAAAPARQLGYQHGVRFAAPSAMILRRSARSSRTPEPVSLKMSTTT
jgi:hypothetical protein